MASHDRLVSDWKSHGDHDLQYYASPLRQPGRSGPGCPGLARAAVQIMVTATARIRKARAGEPEYDRTTCLLTR